MGSAGTWVLVHIMASLFFQASKIDSYNITILHTNDIHARIEQFNGNQADCTAEDLRSRQCYGGMARLSTKVKELRRDIRKNFLFLDAGDQFQGTLWFYLFGVPLISHVMTILQYDAMCPGNHEFDEGVTGLANFIQRVSFPLVSCNMDTRDEPSLANISKYTTFNRGGQVVAVIGYTTPETADISRAGKVIFRPEIESLRNMVEQIERQGVNKIIALGHSGFEMDKLIAENVPGIDVIVGGRSDTFLYTGSPPSSEVADGPYPTVLRSPRNETVLIVQDYAYGKYLGHLEVEFDDTTGLVTAWDGNPILLDVSVQEDINMLQHLSGFRGQLQNLKVKTVATSHVFLDGSPEKCLVEECNMGNLVADAMVRQNVHNLTDTWSDLGIAIINGAGIRNSIDAGPITVGDALNVLPFRHTVDRVQLTGQAILDTLEYCASNWNRNGSPFGGFLQVSGLRISYAMHQPIGKRVADVQILCTDCMIPEYGPIDPKRVYSVLMPSFLADGGDGYEVIRNNTVSRNPNGPYDSDILLADIRMFNPIIKGLDGRIRFLDPEPSSCPDSTTALTSSFSLLLWTLLMTVISPDMIFIL